jgi:hypothetical protein
MDSYEPGSWLLYASLEVLFLVNIAEFLYPGYSVSQNYISDLGVRPEPHGIPKGHAYFVTDGSDGRWGERLLCFCPWVT